MRKTFLLLSILFLFSGIFAQETADSSKRYQKINWIGPSLNVEKPKLWKKTIIPLSIAGLSLSLNSMDTKTKLQDAFRKPFNGFTTKADNYTVIAPVVILGAVDLLKFKAKNSVWNQTKYGAISECMSVGIVLLLKNTLKIERPDHSEFNSFPSGHTAVSFTASQVLYNEFSQTNKFIAYSGFLFSVSTGSLRVINNKHWIPDVLMGAGIGILVTNLVYHFEPLKNWNPWKKKGLNMSFLPTLGNDFLGCNLRIDL